MKPIKHLIMLSGMTQQQFAKYFDIPKRTIESWVSDNPNCGRVCPGYLVDLIEYKLKKEGIIKVYPND